MISIREYDLDIDAAEESILLGPQASLLQKIEQFNSCYINTTAIAPIGMTKRFRFKNGTYDRVKDLYSRKCNLFDKKPSGMYSLKDRIDRSTWLQRSFWKPLISIENDMRVLRDNNIFWQDNTELVKAEWIIMKDRMTTQLESASKLYPNSHIVIDIDDSDGLDRAQVIVTISLQDLRIKIYQLDEQIGSYDWGDIIIRYRINLWTYLNTFCEGGNGQWQGNGGSPQWQATPRYYKTAHPYLGNNGYRVDSTGWNGHLCLGDLSSSIRESAGRLEIESLVAHTNLWLGRYHIPNTNPLNRIINCFYGLPNSIDWAMIRSQTDITPKSRMLQCPWNERFWNLYSAYNLNDVDKSYDVVEKDIRVPNNACDECQFTVHGETENGIKFDPCHKRIVAYNGPFDDEECIEEQLHYYMLCENYISSHRSIFLVEEYDIQRSWDEDGNFCWNPTVDVHVIEENVPGLAFEWLYNAESNQWAHSIATLDFLMGSFEDPSVRSRLEDEYYTLCFPYGTSEDSDGDHDYDVWRDDMESLSTDDLQAAITNWVHPTETERPRARQNLQDTTWDPLEVTHEDGNLTVEEQAIRWAARNGGAINL